MSYLTLPDVTPTSITMLNPEPAVRGQSWRRLSAKNITWPWSSSCALACELVPSYHQDKQILADFLTHSQGVGFVPFCA